ncbi:unnamed protein product (macronuclear) [Paramecium tetraurelia]|uniref:Uncharacterized protein n=1 Tax=Paramecium tetraurelia TaxID=5888 RepID=A0DAJ1_PARTE|nr:uncharacterized protein GSPATT00014965001 [Paramecium tetraurelia]CAK80058.1 unnamed protein product [Paramecium tetraurelia]|eukprot:XP_001447455.1 hypothetical protein (macronuclear) [Paramecium tetraurelia strain d4-2]
MIIEYISQRDPDHLIRDKNLSEKRGKRFFSLINQDIKESILEKITNCDLKVQNLPFEKDSKATRDLFMEYFLTFKSSLQITILCCNRDSYSIYDSMVILYQIIQGFPPLKLKIHNNWVQIYHSNLALTSKFEFDRFIQLVTYSNLNRLLLRQIQGLKIRNHLIQRKEFIHKQQFSIQY